MELTEEQALKVARKELAEMDPRLEDGSPAHQCALVLMLSALLAPEETLLARVADVPLELVREWAARWRANGVWREGRVTALDWMDEKTGGIAFWVHVLVGEGLVARGSGHLHG